MIRSMTAFASVERATAWGTLSAELRAVNHRYLEFSLRAPDDLRGLEPVIRERVAGKVQRGKVEMSLRLKSAASASARELRLDDELLDRLAQAATRQAGRFPNLHVNFTDLLAFPGVLEQNGPDPAGLHAEALAVIDATIDEFCAAREREGAKLAVVLREKLDGIETACANVRQWLPEIRAGLRARLEARFAELAPAMDPGRLEQEFVLWLQKLDVDEELDRLATHVAEARRVLGLKEAVGRRLDFLMQEFNREANTLGSKSVDSRTSQIAVELKVLIEQMREQVQNLE
ncbi:YicC family protein [Xanthomonadaceae bacterium XH05]|nr:YicC family protein [Xanthomonadaceae bacterium XH05]